ncbi:hypothetical protein SELMODRAFT_427845 [Selaginella moellendorffii]|uniref:Ty3 transposon capsid-like protein domain-containing protein n=1 Tax=Selaginella moellendorffii TaxID=88036 RepID=D8T0W2_SELML|nr:hypothetical protein SELMODRAFT_427845 [Selaginella moellendorffii]
MREIPPEVKARQEDEQKVHSKKRDALREVEAIKLRERRQLEEEEAEEQDRITQEQARLDQELARGRTETGILRGPVYERYEHNSEEREPTRRRSFVDRFKDSSPGRILSSVRSIFGRKDKEAVIDDAKDEGEDREKRSDDTDRSQKKLDFNQYFHALGNQQVVQPILVSMAGTSNPVIMKKALPPTFHGMENEDYEQHLKQFNAACALNNEITDVEKIALFPFTLKGDAAEWFYDRNATYATFAALSDDFKGYYKKKYECHDPVVRLQEIYQGDTELAEDYARRFNKFYGRCDATTVPNVLAMNWFLNGLRSEMQTPARLEAPTTLDTARAAAEKVDKILHKTSNALRRELHTKGGVDRPEERIYSAPSVRMKVTMQMSAKSPDVRYAIKQDMEQGAVDTTALSNLSDSRTKIINNFDFQPHINPSSYQDQVRLPTSRATGVDRKDTTPPLAQMSNKTKEKVVQRLSPKKSDTLIMIKDEPMTSDSQLEESRQQGDPPNEELGERLVELIMERPVTLTVGELITVAPYLCDHLYNTPGRQVRRLAELEVHKVEIAEADLYQMTVDSTDAMKNLGLTEKFVKPSAKNVREESVEKLIEQRDETLAMHTNEELEEIDLTNPSEEPKKLKIAKGKIKPIGHKFVPKWKGPYVVREVNLNGNVLLEELNDPDAQHSTNINKLTKLRHNPLLLLPKTDSQVSLGEPLPAIDEEESELEKEQEEEEAEVEPWHTEVHWEESSNEDTGEMEVKMKLRDTYGKPEKEFDWHWIMRTLLHKYAQHQVNINQEIMEYVIRGFNVEQRMLCFEGRETPVTEAKI